MTDHGANTKPPAAPNKRRGRRSDAPQTGGKGLTRLASGTSAGHALAEEKGLTRQHALAQTRTCPQLSKGRGPISNGISEKRIRKSGSTESTRRAAAGRDGLANVLA